MELESIGIYMAGKSASCDLLELELLYLLEAKGTIDAVYRTSCTMYSVIVSD